MARGPKKHMKRLSCPSHWMLSKMGGVFAPRPSPGPHKLRECLPLVIMLRNRLKYALTRREVITIVMGRSIKVDGKVRTDANYPAGFMDVISIEKTNQNFRLLYDTKGRFTLKPINKAESKYKLCRVKKYAKAGKSYMGTNPLAHGQSQSIPYIVTHDGRTIRYPDPVVRENDTVRIDLESGKITDHIKYEVGNLAMVTGGRNRGRVGIVVHKEKHPGSFEVVHIKDAAGRQFATRSAFVFVIGKGNQPMVALPKNKGIYTTPLEERAAMHRKGLL